ncbi:uncharacterized protein STEHIDRAFT_132655 [Stereum hirsutum FP-91666 SS1]|uniref:uncharacterized protein n=1 Tax=Stereum hirsutum (strain FP-91666) TaxID=721885 RepID=UPI000444A7CA|nr:uncharacterized protein STEHIDRAFT_132655 [Stereum hirsutum FP-91666 SS1]EIM84248.1 hypothetical protein STEHIDRAFT_132655 [Stereum hirsutum FP-91666 SS1]
MKRHLYTLVLFTWTDYKTIFLPVMTFACATGPISTYRHFIKTVVWVLTHLLICNVSNQAKSEDEDSVNRPWRPLPSKRITRSQAISLKWIMVSAGMSFSIACGTQFVILTLALVLTTVLYDDVGLSRSFVGKNACNILGYAVFESAAVALMAPHSKFDSVSLWAIALSAILIFTTIQAQDFSDVEGDALAGRVTFPIYAPEFSRLATLLTTTAWSVFYGWFWGVGPVIRVLLAVLGTAVGVRYYKLRTPVADKRTYVLYNVCD